MARQQKLAERIAEYFHEDAVKSMYGDEIEDVDVKRPIGPPPVLQKEGVSPEERRQAVDDAFAWLKRQMVETSKSTASFVGFVYCTCCVISRPIGPWGFHAFTASWLDFLFVCLLMQMSLKLDGVKLDVVGVSSP